MKKFNTMTSIAAMAAAGALALLGCSSPDKEQSAQPSQSQTAAESLSGESHAHAADGGQPPEGIKKAADPKYAMGENVVLTADHMEGMAGAKATISGAFDTTTYSVSYTPTDGSDAVTDHKWVVQEELENPGKPPLKDGTEVVVNADHMPGMTGARATIDSSTDETVYMVDVDMGDMTMTNHKWVTESEIQHAK